MFSVFVEKRVFASRSDGGDHDHVLFDESMLAKVQLIKSQHCSIEVDSLKTHKSPPHSRRQ